MTDSKTSEVNRSQTLRELFDDLTDAEKDTTQFVLSVGIGHRITVLWAGNPPSLRELSAKAAAVIKDAFGDETKASELRQAGRLN